MSSQESRERFEAHCRQLEPNCDLAYDDKYNRYRTYATSLRWEGWQAALADRPEPAQHQIRHVNGLYPPSTNIRLQVLGCSGTSEYTDIDVQLPCAPQEPAQPVAHWRHVKRGTTYVTAGQAMAQCSTGPINDGDTTQIYRGTDGWLYVRKVEEFQDGRFERIDAPPSHPATSAYVFSAHDQEIIKDIEAMQHKDGWWERALAVGALRIIRSLAATQPAPSEAGAERQEHVAPACTYPNCKCHLLGDCLAAQFYTAAQPAKGDAS